MNKVKIKIKKIFQRKPLSYLLKIYDNNMAKLKWKFHIKIRRLKVILFTQTHFSFGKENKDKVFFVIKSPGSTMGLYSIILFILPYIKYAIHKGYIPIIDFKNSYNGLIQDSDKKGKENAWEYYYKQPIKTYTLDDVYQSRRVIMTIEGINRKDTPNWNDMFPCSEQDLRFWNNIISSYIRPNDVVMNKISEKYEKLFKSTGKVMGVGVRAGYRRGMLLNEALYNGHPKVPSCEEFLGIVNEKLKEWKCDHIFLACDDREYLQKFLDFFGDKCIYMQRRLKHYFENDKPVKEIDQCMIEYEDSTIRETTEDYMVETYLLSKCDCLYSCIGGGAEFAYFVNGGKYEHLEVYNEGKI